jgi:hypothetical protein
LPEHRRWPLHPPPYPGEALSSWIYRIAQALGVHPAVLLGDDPAVTQKKARKYHSDFNPPEFVIRSLAEGTGQSMESVRRLSACGYVPSLLDHVDLGADGMAAYTQGLAFLLSIECRSQQRYRYARSHPWYSHARFRKPRGCRDCLAEGPESYLRLSWRFAWMLCCPIHRRMLEPMVMHPPAAEPMQLTWECAERTQEVSPQVLMIDALTMQAMTEGECRLPCGIVPGAFWIRLLRTVIEELGVGQDAAGDHRRILKDLWGSIGRDFEPYLRSWRPYEIIEETYQEMFVTMAAHAFTHAFESPWMRDRLMGMARTYQETLQNRPQGSASLLAPAAGGAA